MKTALYRVRMICVSVTVAYLAVGDVSAALSTGLVTNAVKTATHYGHERLRDRIAWGAGGGMSARRCVNCRRAPVRFIPPRSLHPSVTDRAAVRVSARPIPPVPGGR